MDRTEEDREIADGGVSAPALVDVEENDDELDEYLACGYGLSSTGDVGPCEPCESQQWSLDVEEGMDDVTMLGTEPLHFGPQ